MLELFRIYGRSLSRLPRDIGRSPWALLVPVIYSLAMQLATMLVGLVFRGPLELVGGFIMGFVQAALAAAFLYFVDEMVSGSPVRLKELPESFRRYLWPVVSVLFVFWIANLLAGRLLTQMPTWLVLALAAALLILLNVTPEIIYQRRLTQGLEILRGSVDFIQEHWIEWFIPNLPLTLLVGALSMGFIPAPALLRSLLGPTLGHMVFDVIIGGFVFLLFLFRGHLFAALDGGRLRANRFRYGR